MSRDIKKLFAHLTWADQKVLDALRADSGSEARVLDYFAHVLAAEHVWLTRIQGVPARVAVWPTLSLGECEAIGRENAMGYMALLMGATPDDLEALVRYVNSAGASFASSLEDILIHVALHGAYHRGQVSLMMRLGGGTPAPTDYIGFVRGTPAATERDAERASRRSSD